MTTPQTAVHVRFGERGSATLELVILAPGLIALLVLVIIAGRLETAAGAVEQAAASAARAASLARDARGGQAQADQAATAALGGQGITCQPLGVWVNTAGFSTSIGHPAEVSVAVACTVSMADVALPLLPGRRTLTASMTSPIDSYRGRQ